MSTLADHHYHNLGGEGMSAYGNSVSDHIFMEIQTKFVILSGSKIIPKKVLSPSNADARIVMEKF